jgi:hypothetical protein
MGRQTEGGQSPALLGILPGLMLARNELIEKVRSIESQLQMGDSLAAYLSPLSNGHRIGRPPGGRVEVDVAEVDRMRKDGASWNDIGRKFDTTGDTVKKHWVRAQAPAAPHGRGGPAMRKAKSEEPGPELVPPKKKRVVSPEGEARRRKGYLAHLKRKGFKAKKAAKKATA